MHCLALDDFGLVSMTPNRVEEMSHLSNRFCQIIETQRSITVQIHRSLRSVFFNFCG